MSAGISVLPIFVVTVAVFGVAIVAMAVGVMLGRRPISGSCGGLANSRDELGNPVCGICSNPDPNCKSPVGKVDQRSAD